MKFIAPLLFIFFYCIQFFDCEDRINEKYTWTRISYVWPPESRIGYGHYGHFKPSTTGGGFVFPDSVSTNGKDVPPNVNYIFGKIYFNDFFKIELWMSNKMLEVN